MKEIGELLKKTRQEKGQSLEEISAQTKIQIAILRRIEDGSAEQLPNKAYLKGFLRTYARALGLNPEEVLHQFDKDSPTAASEKNVTITRVAEEMPDKTNVLWFRAPAKFITLASILLIGLLTTAIYFLSMKIVSYSKETFTDAPTAETSSGPTEVPAIPGLPGTDESVLALPGATPTAEPAPNAKTAPPAEDVKPKMVSIEANENVTIEAVWSTGKKENIKLRTDSRHVFYYAKKIKLTVSNGGAVSIKAGDKDLGVPGQAGNPATLEFD